MSKYDPLEYHLRKLSGDSWTARFDDLEKILGFGLPASARKYPAWWANEASDETTHSHARSWREAGWRTGDVDLGSHRVTFRRDRFVASVPRKRIAFQDVPVTIALPTPPPTKPELPILSPYPWDEPDQVDCRVTFRWQPVGRVVLDERDFLAFPRVPTVPGIYRLQIRGDRGHATYIGEAEDLQRRLQGYRTPGIGQLTNIRIRDRLLEALRAEDEVALAIVTTGVHIEIQGKTTPVDLSAKVIRQILENSALTAGGSELAESLNR